MNLLRQKLNDGKLIKGTLVSLTDPCLCEIVGNVGFDCVWIDTEHTYMSYKEVLCHLNGARSSGVASLVRVPQNDLTATKKILEMGPDGILFPMCRSLDEFNTLMEMTLYPPYGTRGFGPIRAINYSAAKAAEYVRTDHKGTCKFVQIESVQMIDELDKIAKNPYVDGFIFGPNDLSGSVGEFLNVYGEKTISEVNRAMEILRQHGKKVGVAVGHSRESIKFWSKFDFDLFFAGADWNFVYDMAASTLALLKDTEK